MTILYTKEQLETVGINFPTLQGLNVKEVRISEKNQVVAIVDVESEYYYLPQENIVEQEEITYTIETDEITDTPIMVKVTNQIPMLDENGEHSFYFQTYTFQEQVGTETDEEGNEIPIYEDVEYTSETPIYLYTTEEIEEPSGKYYKEITETIENLIEIEPELILADDERWTEELKRVYVEKEIPLDDEIRGLPKSDNLREDVNKIKDRLKTAHEVYEHVFANQNSTLADLKLAKIDKLDEDCNIAITKGFKYKLDGVVYLFSSSIHAQANFQGTDTLFKDELIEEAEWTVTNLSNGKIERVIINREHFNNLKLLLFKHINDNISKLRNEMQPLVEIAETKEEVHNIVWE